MIKALFQKVILPKKLTLVLSVLLLGGLFFTPLHDAVAQSLTLDLGSAGTDNNPGSVTARMVQLILLMTVLSLAPSILVMMTSFTRIIVVLSFLRTAMGLQQTPPNTVLISLAMFMTLFIMQPVFERAYDEAFVPLVNQEIDELTAFEQAMEPFHDFMIKNTRESDLQLFFDVGGIPPVETAADTPFRVVIPAFMISELRRAFEIGFMIFMPFLIIDLVTASILMSMGMMMLPPVMISLPFKIIFFVLVDGWYLIVGSLIESFAQ